MNLIEAIFNQEESKEISEIRSHLNEELRA